MCMEDINIGRETRATMHTFTVGAADQKLLDYNPYRVGLILSAPPSGSVTYSWAAITNQGLGWHMVNGTQPLKLNIRDDGEAVKQELHSLADAATRRISVTEITLARMEHGQAPK